LATLLADPGIGHISLIRKYFFEQLEIFQFTFLVSFLTLLLLQVLFAANIIHGWHMKRTKI
jgi:hypothetical protein